MTVSNLIPRRKNREIAESRSSAIAQEQRDPFLALHREVNRLFDDLWNGFGFGGEMSRPGWPSIDLVESDDSYVLTAELPGVEEKDVEVLLSDRVLTLRGEKKSPHADERRRFGERYYGRFERQMELPVEIEQDKVAAAFRNGVLTVTLPKSKEAQRSVKRIPLQTS